MTLHSLSTAAAAFALSLLVTTIANAAPRIHDHTDEFLEYWDSAKHLPMPDQVARFKSEVVPIFPEFYAFKFEKWRAAGLDIDQELAKTLLEFPSLEPEFRRRAGDFARTMSEAMASFKGSFADFDDEIDIYVVHSLLEMDGGMRQIDGKRYVIFGVDGMAKYHAGLNPRPFFHHELFHQYHAQHGYEIDRLFEAVWSEGLATYVSALLNPSADTGDLGLDHPPGMPGQCWEFMDFLVGDLNARLESTSDGDYETYMLLSSEHEFVPKRAGYYLGYLIAASSHRSISLRELIDLKDDLLLAQVRRALQTLDPFP